MYSPGYDCPGIYVAAVFGFPQPYAARVYVCPGVVGFPGFMLPRPSAFHSRVPPGSMPARELRASRDMCSLRASMAFQPFPFLFPGYFYLPGYGQGRPGYGSPAVISPSVFLYLFLLLYLFCSVYFFRPPPAYGFKSGLVARALSPMVEALCKTAVLPGAMTPVSPIINRAVLNPIMNL